MTMSFTKKNSSGKNKSAAGSDQGEGQKQSFRNSVKNLKLSNALLSMLVQRTFTKNSITLGKRSRDQGLLFILTQKDLKAKDIVKKKP